MKFRVLEGRPGHLDSYGFYPQYSYFGVFWKGIFSDGGLCRALSAGTRCDNLEEAFRVIERAKTRDSYKIHRYPLPEKEKFL